MNRKQALAMLQFIADLYGIIQIPELDQAEQSEVNGRGEYGSRKTEPVATAAE
jgi:hypothetical protein